MDTIFALATAKGKAGVSIVRISGPDALKLAHQMGAQLTGHDRRLVRLVNDDGSLIDQAFGLSFAEGKSFTGEPVVELHTHGSPAVVESVMSRLLALGGRPAEAGEFTKRAMENGQLDLAQVEGLADLIDAETEAQRRQAARVFDGALGNLVDRWRGKLLRAAALMEATIDFVDEDVPVDVFPEVKTLLKEVFTDVRREADGVSFRERLRDGFEVALIGPPNSGKSTLLNRLAGRDAAITSDIPGTTRDTIEVQMNLEGYPVTFIDTAGLRETEDPIEAMGIERGKDRSRNADIRLYLSDGSADVSFDGESADFLVRTKADIRELGQGDISVSALTGEGIDRLLDVLVDHLSKMAGQDGVATRSRHERAMRLALAGLEGVLPQLDQEDVLVDLLAEDVRAVIRNLDVLIGRIDTESVLGEIFSSFCIGK